MQRLPWLVAIAVTVGLSVAACSDDESTASDTGGNDLGADLGPDVTLPAGCDALATPSDAAYAPVQQLLIETPADSVICFEEGTYRFDEEISLTTRGITLRGMGDGDGVIFDFSDQQGAANGLLVTGDEFTIENLSIRNSPGDGIRVEGAQNVVFRNLDVRWDGEPREENGAYAIYPVLCDTVLVEDSVVFGAADAGIYVGQSSNIVVRRNEVHGNVAGIEIENSFDAEVYDNEAYDNTAGILIFNLQDLPAGDGEGTRVFDNLVRDNNRENFAVPGTIVAAVPPGIGILILAYDTVEVTGNTFRNNLSTGITIVSTFTINILNPGAGPVDDPNHDPYPETIWIHDNTYESNGSEPQGDLADLFDPPLEDILWDGVVDSEKPNGDGALDLCIDEEGSVTFLNFDTSGGLANPTTDRSPHDCTHDSLPPLDLFPEE